MEQKEFNYYVEQHIKEFLPENVSVSLCSTNKINDTVCHGLRFFEEGKNVSPVIYLEKPWQDYQNGRTMEAILDELSQYHDAKLPLPEADLRMEYENAKDRITFFVVNKGENRQNLRNLLHRDIGCGFVEVCAVHYKDENEEMISNVMITRSIAQTWGIDETEIWKAAEQNTPEHLPVILQSLQSAMFGKPEDEFQNENLGNEIAYVLTNTEKYRGAAVLFYPGMQQRIAEYFGKNYYVLPSSIHELLIIPEREKMQPEEMERNVKEINASAVRKEDFLSDKVLYYDREKEQLRLAIPETMSKHLEHDKRIEER